MIFKNFFILNGKNENELMIFYLKNRNWIHTIDFYHRDIIMYDTLNYNISFFYLK